MQKIKELFKNISFTSFNRRSFWIALIGGFLMALIQRAGVEFKLFPPIQEKANQVQAQVIENIFPKLEKTENTFKLKDKSSLNTFPVNDNARAYIVVNMDTGEILAQKNATTELSIASLTKVMTSVVALDLAEPTDEFTVTERASKIEPTKIGVVPGQKMSVSELLHAMLLTSANDAAEVVREGINAKYQQEVFVEAMNKKAQFLGMNQSHFANPQGFDNRRNYSTARDLAVLALYAMKNYPLIDQIAKKDYAFLPENGTHKQFDLYNWNGLIDVYPDTFGLKIGMTENAGYTTIVMSERGGTRMMAIALGTRDIVTRDMTAANLLDVGYMLSRKLQPVAVNEQMLKEKYGRWQYWN